MTLTFDHKEIVGGPSGDGVMSNASPMDAEMARLSGHIVSTPEGVKTLSLFVPAMMCGGCMQKVEAALGAMPEVEFARTNLSARRVTVSWNGANAVARDLLGRLKDAGFEASPYAIEAIETADADIDRSFLKALAVAGFGAANIMLLSVAVWSGFGGNMELETRQLFHWVSALIAVPVVGYSGRPFFRSAYAALRAKRMNMDVPISLAIVLAVSASLGQLMIGGEHAYFDAAVTLLFFLLIGRYLEQHMRRRAGSAVKDLLALKTETTIRVRPDGSAETVSSDTLNEGDLIFVPKGFVISADGCVVDGQSEVDVSVMTGESMPIWAKPDSDVFAGTTNLSSDLTVKVTAKSEDSMLAEITRLMEVAEQGQGVYRKISDRVAAIYAPAVHIIAAATVLGWLLAGLTWPEALMIGVSVLIITCPCAVALAIPVVNIVAVGRLFRNGILCKSEDALERMSQITSVFFDKTGTLTEGRLTLQEPATGEREALALAASLAQSSSHPLSRALVRAAQDAGIHPYPAAVDEIPGQGLVAHIDGQTVRIGKAEFVGLNMPAGDGRSTDETAVVYLKRGNDAPIRFAFDETLRPSAIEVCHEVQSDGLPITLLSGDGDRPAHIVADRLGIDHCHARLSPLEKASFVRNATGAGDRPLYIGDGINDGPAAQEAFVTMAPGDGARLSQTVADFVFQNNDLASITETMHVSRKAQRLVKQNLLLAFGYNAVAIPLSILGFATPLVAAVAMSSSSLLVTLNALRLHEKAPGLVRS